MFPLKMFLFVIPSHPQAAPEWLVFSALSQWLWNPWSIGFCDWGHMTFLMTKKGPSHLKMENSENSPKFVFLGFLSMVFSAPKCPLHLGDPIQVMGILHPKDLDSAQWRRRRRNWYIQVDTNGGFMASPIIFRLAPKVMLPGFCSPHSHLLTLYK